MAYEKTILSKMQPRTCYDLALTSLTQNGFKIMRKRELAWLVQASKDVGGKSRVVNVTCRPGVQTQVTVSCLTSGTRPDEVEKTVTDSLFQELANQLNAE